MLEVYDLTTEYLSNPECIDNLHPRFAWKMRWPEHYGVKQTSWRIVCFMYEETPDLSNAAGTEAVSTIDAILWDSGAVHSDAQRHIRYAGEALKSRMRVFWKVAITAVDENGAESTVTSDPQHFTMGLLEDSDWMAQWIEPAEDMEPSPAPSPEDVCAAGPEENARPAEPDRSSRSSADNRPEPQQHPTEGSSPATSTCRPVPYLRRSFTVKAHLKSARLYQTAHGLYESWLNGVLPTQDKFKPGLTSYYWRIQYQSYDVTGLLREGDNVWSAALGDGWWRGSTGGTCVNNFGYRLAYLGQLELCYEDGGRETVTTDASWKCSTGSILASDMMMGDIVDAAREPVGWKYSGFDDTAWHPVHAIRQEDAKAHPTAERYTAGTEACAGMELGYDAKLIASRSVPVREKEHFEPRIFRDAAGSTILDFGQNIAGYVRMRLRHTTRGQRVHLVHGEDIRDGVFSVESIRKTSVHLSDTFQEITYDCLGTENRMETENHIEVGKDPEHCSMTSADSHAVYHDAYEEYKPLFSVFGFRYVKLEGYDASLIEPGDFTAIAVYSDMPRTGYFRCSNPLLNRLVENALWSQKGNYLDVPTDCPTRERNAWTGDNQVYIQTACWFFDSYPFYEKWLADQAIEQYESGKVGITFPSTSSVHNPAELPVQKKRSGLSELAGPAGNGNLGEDSVGWGDSAVWIPYIVYLRYGDPQILLNQYGAARKWANYLLRCAKDPNPLYADQPAYHRVSTWKDPDGSMVNVPDCEYIYDTRMHYGEWLEPIPKTLEEMEEAKDPAALVMKWLREGKPEVATAYMRRSTLNVAEMAEYLIDAAEAGEIPMTEEKLRGLRKDADRYRTISERIAVIYDRYFIAADGTIAPGHQAPYVRALVMNLVSDRKRSQVVQQLVQEVKANGCRLNTGFLSTPFLLSTLVESGYPDLAYRLLEQTEAPGWLHPILLGATTIPENWYGMDTHEGSLNHYSYGAVCDFLFKYVAGIRPDTIAGDAKADPGCHAGADGNGFDSDFDQTSCGFRHFVLAPLPGGSLTQAEAAFDSPYGRIVSGWEKLCDGTWTYQCQIPEGTSAEVRLPDGSIRQLGSGEYHFTWKDASSGGSSHT